MDYNRNEHTALNHSLGIETKVSKENHDLMKSAEGVNPKLLIVQDDVMTHFWDRGCIETRNWNWIMLSIRFPFEVAYVMSPMNQSQFYTLVAYTSLSVILIAMQIASYKVKSMVKKELLINVVLFLLNIRISLVFLDYEEVKHLLDDPEQPGRKSHFDWAQDIQAITSLQVVNLLMMSQYFNRTTL